MISLKDQLKNHLQTIGYLRYDELEMWCRDNHFGKVYKIDTARRRLDELPVKKTEKNGSTILWEWAGDPPQVPPEFKVEVVNKDLVRVNY